MQPMLEEVTGPYDATSYGTCFQSHPLNRYGRCQPQNEGFYPDAETQKAETEDAGRYVVSQPIQSGPVETKASEDPTVPLSDQEK